MDKAVVTELIQNEFTSQRLKEELFHIIDEYKRAVMFLDYYDLEKKLGGKGASNKTANLIIDAIK